MLAASLLAASASAWGPPSLLCRLDDPRVTESSGLAPSITQKGVWYTHNDSGDSPRFFRFNTKGEVTGVFGLRGAQAFDWEDMASQKVGGKSWIYLGDIGDNARVRKSLTIYRVEEPMGASRSLEVESAYQVAYEDKARDCEALFVAPGSGDLWLVTKARDGETWAYVVRKPKSRGMNIARKVAKLDINQGASGGLELVTGGDVSADGKRVIIRTYTKALEYQAGRRLDDWVKSSPQIVTLPQERQGEAISYSRDGKTLLTTSEGEACPVSILKKNK